MHKILFTGCTFDEKKIETCKNYGLEIIPASSNLSKEELIQALQICDGVIVNGEEFYDEDILKNCPNLKVIQFFGIGYQKCVNLDVALKYNKIVANTPKVNSYSVAEFSLGLLFSLNQKILIHNENTRNQIWEEKQFFDLKNKTIGIIGMGHIGTYFAEIMYNAFQCKILYYDLVKKNEVEEKFHAYQVSLETLLQNSDVVSLNLPLTPDTRNLIGEKELSLMKKEAYFINTARAEIVDAEALYNILIEDKIAGCAYDGFYQEPIDMNAKEAKLLTLPNGKFLLTPHTGHFAVEGKERVEKMCIENLIHIFNNEDCRGIIKK